MTKPSLNLQATLKASVPRLTSGLPTIRELKVRIPLAQVIRCAGIYRDSFH
jgi:hypothetical protein